MRKRHLRVFVLGRFEPLYDQVVERLTEAGFRVVADFKTRPDVVVDLRHPSSWIESPIRADLPPVVVVAQNVAGCSQAEAFDCDATAYVWSLDGLCDAVRAATRTGKFAPAA